METRRRRRDEDGMETRRRRGGDESRRRRDKEDGDGYETEKTETKTVLEMSRDGVEGDGEGRRSIYKGCQNNNKSITKREEVLYTRLEGSSENYFVSRLALLVMMSIAKSRHTWSRQRFDCIE